MFNAKQWRRYYEAARTPAEREIWKEDVAGELKGCKEGELHIRDIFEQFVEDGTTIVNDWRRHDFEEGEGRGVNLVEAAVDTSMFSNITGQIVYNKILEAWNQPNFLADGLAMTVTTNFLDGEKIAGISQLGDVAEAVGEGQAYPTAGVSEEWIETPRTTKRGFIVPVTKEAIVADRTGIILQRAGDVTLSLRINKEKRVIDEVLGVTNTYRRNGGAEQNTYGDTHTNGDFDNLLAANDLVDWTDIDAALNLFDAITDPNTAEPIVLQATTIIVARGRVMAAARIVNATEIRTGTDPITITPSLLPSIPELAGNTLTIISSAYIQARMTAGSVAANSWWIGQPSRAFNYMQVWPITATQAPANSELEFTHDVVQRYKVSERGVVATVEPRYMVKCLAS